MTDLELKEAQIKQQIKASLRLDYFFDAEKYEAQLEMVQEQIKKESWLKIYFEITYRKGWIDGAEEARKAIKNNSEMRSFYSLKQLATDNYTNEVKPLLMLNGIINLKKK